ncbi:MAG: carbohydrate kinase family protein [Gammaproteobacteria bacterium]|nr:carbohydrate kinase family protein [Gammaproteobacteria bacterium]
MKALICGSFAYDTILAFPDRFKNHILPEKIHILNVAFVTSDMRREFGGTAGNIAYNLRLLGGDGAAMGTVGRDFDPYAAWMDKHGVDRSLVKVIDEEFTAQAVITTDLDDNQITAFHPGAMAFSHQTKATEARGVSLAILSPDGREGTIAHAEQCAEAGIPFIFDPGQNTPVFTADEYARFIDIATFMTVNDYEWELVQSKCGLTLDQARAKLDALIVTRGGQGSIIYTPDAEYQIPVAKPAKVVEPTGCGDAFRAGLMYGLMNKLDWEITGRIASLMGAYNIAQHGTQNHHFSRSEFEGRFKENFGMAMS